MANLEKSLAIEMLRTNDRGAYASTTIVDCNTRKYHGLLTVPIPEMDDDNHVLLSSCDETVVQHGAEFNLGVHKYGYNCFSPNGHKYIREFHIDAVTSTIYRIGGVILKKDRILESGADRILIRYTLLEAHSPTVLRLKPFLAFRNVNELTHENGAADTSYRTVDGGIACRMYPGYPELVMQISKKAEFVYLPDWYRGLKYPKEQERGYDYEEDLFVPGYFELPIKKGEPVIFAAGTEPVNVRSLKRLYDSEAEKRMVRSDFYSCLKSTALQFCNRKDDGYYVIAGYPWFKYRARDEFVSLPGLTLSTDNVEMFEKVMLNGTKAVQEFLSGGSNTTRLYDMDVPDVLLWYIWAVQQYAIKVSTKLAAEKYGDTVLDVTDFIRRQRHPNLFMHDSGLLYTDGKRVPVTWMNAMDNGRPVNPRSGYIVEINALWFNALKFASEVAAVKGHDNISDLLNYQSEMLRRSFVGTFWNGDYLYDYVDGDYQDREVRPNMIFAVSLPYSPLEREQQRAVVDIVTRELLTVKGLRSLSPKSGMYRPVYAGGPQERDRIYHNGPVWPWTISAYAEAYYKVYRMSGLSFLVRVLAGFEPEMSQLTVGTLSELYEGNPPFKGHGAMSFAMSVAGVLRAYDLVHNVLNETMSAGTARQEAKEEEEEE